jgi:hypothetical protein
LIKESVEDKDGSSWVHFAVWHNNEKFYDLLSQMKFCFDQKNYMGVTPLMISCFRYIQNSAIFKKLLKVVKNINT